MIKKPIIVSNDAKINIFIVGYKNIGESIVIEIEDSKLQTPICGVIDCYETKNLNWALNFLNSKNVNKLQFLLWSHPDDDHSKGLDKILRKFKFNIDTLCVSDGLSITEIDKSIKHNNHDNGNFDYMADIFECIKEISECIEDKFISVNHSTRELKIPFLFSNGESIDFTIKPFAPLSTICLNEKIKLFDNIINKENHSISKNKISIGFIITLGERKICFTGDMINEVLNYKSYKNNLKELFEGVDVFKIPHHGGKSSDKFIDILPKIIEIASVTRYQTTNPDLDIIKRYKQRSNKVLCTSKLDYSQNVKDIGVIKISIPFDSSKCITTHTDENACQL
ncbi:hypothetical protein J6G99_08485 [bacterium]|nr:hypothetical protein [bacterium]